MEAIAEKRGRAAKHYKKREDRRVKQKAIAHES